MRVEGDARFFLACEERSTPRSTFLWSLVKNAQGACTQCDTWSKIPPEYPQLISFCTLIFPCSLFGPVP